jgi:hypothetical protein
MLWRRCPGTVLVVETVPAFLISVVVGNVDDTLAALLRPCGRQVGDRVEVDLDLLADAGRPDLAALLRGYWESCREFWAVWERGESPGEYIALRREVTRDTQRNTKTVKRDLAGHLDALEALPTIGVLVSAMTDSAPEWDAIVAAGQPFQLSVERDGDRTWASFWVENAGVWARELGGKRSLGEVRRCLKLRIEHAKWRDRRVRRLAEVIVEVEEVWPMPARLRTGVR